MSKVNRSEKTTYTYEFEEPFVCRAVGAYTSRYKITRAHHVVSMINGVYMESWWYEGIPFNGMQMRQRQLVPSDEKRIIEACLKHDANVMTA